MNFHYGAIPEVEDFHPEAKSVWQRLKEPSPSKIQILAIPVALLFAVPILLFFPEASNPSDEPLHSLFTDGFVYLFLMFLVVLPVHEFIHACFHPGNGFKSGTLYGFWPSQFVFYAAWLGEWSRNRMIACLLAPVVFLTGVFYCIQSVHPTMELPYFAAFHVLMSSVDLMGAFLLLWGVPANGIVRNQGWSTWWRLPSS